MLNQILVIRILSIILTLGLLSFFTSRKKLLICLLSLEFMLLGIFLLIIFKFSVIQQSISNSIFILVLGACEARLGLSLLINIARFKGNDMLRKMVLKF